MTGSVGIRVLVDEVSFHFPTHRVFYLFFHSLSGGYSRDIREILELRQEVGE